MGQSHSSGKHDHIWLTGPLITPAQNDTDTQPIISSESSSPANDLSSSLPSSNTTTIALHNALAVSTEPSGSSSSQHSTQLSRNAIIGIAIGIFAAVILGLALMLLVLRRRKRARQRGEQPRSHDPDPPLPPSDTQSSWSKYGFKKNTMPGAATTPGPQRGRVRDSASEPLIPRKPES